MKKTSNLVIGIALLLAGTNVAFGQPDPVVGVSTSNTASGNAVGYFTTNIGGAGDHPPPYAPGLITAPVASPTLFTTQGLPAHVRGFPLLMGNLFDPSRHDVAIGASRGTKIVYNGTEVPRRPERRERKILYSFYGVADGEVVGSITIQSRKNAAEDVDIPTMVYDAGRYVDDLRELKGYDITLLSLPNALSFMSGVDTRANGVAISPYVSGFVNGPAGALVGVVPSVSKSGGVTVPTAVIGCTFLVLVDGERSRRVDVRQIYTPAPPVVVPQPSVKQKPAVEENGRKRTIQKKKFEAEQVK